MNQLHAQGKTSEATKSKPKDPVKTKKTKTAAPAVQTAPVFTPGNLIVAVSGCATEGGTCTSNTYPGASGSINGPAGGYGDDQAAPWTLFQFSVNGASSATYLNSVQLPQLQSGANLPISNDYGSLSEGTVQLTGDGRFLTMYGFGINASTFNGNYTNYCPGNTGTLASSCVPENGNPALAQTGSLLGQTYTGNIPVPRVAAIVDPYGNVNTSTVLYNIHNQNDARSAWSANGSTIYVSGQGCKTWDASDMLCDNTATLYDDTMGVYLSPVGVTNNAPTPITGPDNGPTNCTSLSTCDSSADTRMITAYNGTLYVSIDTKPGSSSGGYNRSYIGTLGAPGSTSVYTCTGNGGGCPTGDGPYGPSIMPGLGNSGGTGKYTLNTAGSGNTSNGNGLSAGLAVNLGEQNFFFASPTVLYVADTGFPKNTSNGPDAVCTTDGGKSGATVGNGGLEKWILNPTITATVTSGSTTVSASSGAFSQGMVGLTVTGTGIPSGTTVSSVTSAGANITLSNKATASGTSVTISGWTLAYTLYNGLNLVLNSDCNPASPVNPGVDATTGLYGVTGTVSNGVATLYVTTYPDNDLINSYLFGITDTLATTKMTSPGTGFTLLATAPSDSVFRGVSMAPSLPNGSETITSTPSGMTFSVSGSGCATGTYITPTTLSWTGTSCTLSVSPSQTISGGPVNPVSTTYTFASWQDGTTNAASDVVTTPATTGTYNFSFQTQPTVIFPTASYILAGQALSSSTLSGGSAEVSLSGATVAGSFAFNNPSATPAAGNTVQTVTFTPSDNVDYTAVSGPVNVAVYGTPLGNLETAIDSSTGSTTVKSNDSIYINGWAADPTDGAPVTSVQIYIDGNLVGPPTVGISRPDVASYFNNSAYTNSGFTLVYPAASLAAGPHSITAVVTNGGGVKTVLGPLSITVTTVYPAPIGNLETADDARTGSTTVGSTDNLYVSGWIADPTDGSPLSNVTVLIDGSSVGAPTLGISRPDVASYYNNPAYANSGFTFTYAASSLTATTHTITVMGTNSHGVSTTLGPLSITVQHVNVPPVGNLETAADLSTQQTTISQSTGTLYVNGWAADYQDNGPAKSVEILIDGAPFAAATLGISRPDVASYYNNPAWSNTGFQLTSSVSSLSQTTHQVTATATDSLNLSTTFGPLQITVTP